MMTEYFVIEPEVAGGWGKDTQFTRIPGQPTVVHKLHYEFDGWLGDELLESTPCYIVTDRLAHEIGRAQLSGVKFDDLKVTTSEQFRDLHPNLHLPKFVWLKVEGRPGHDDFGIAPGLQLVVSERAFELLKRIGLQHYASVTRFEG